MGPRINHRLLLLAGAGLALALWLLSTSASTRRGPEPVAPWTTPGAALPVTAPPALSTILRADSKRKELRIQDRLSAATLDLTVRLCEGGSELQSLHAGEMVDLSQLPQDCSLVYPLGPMNMQHTALLGECLRESADHWLLSLPYSCRLEFELQAENLPGAEIAGQVLLCQDPRSLPELPSTEDRPGPFTLAVQDMTLEGLMHWKLRSGQVKAAQQAALSAENPVPLTFAGAGAFVVSAQFANGASGTSALTLVPGKIIPVPIALRARPSVRGRLLDWKGQPVPNEKVVLTVVLDLKDYDFRLSDPHALMAYRDEGVLTHSVKKTYRTDDSGSFEWEVPRGREYALYSHALGGYAFWSTVNEDSAPAESLSIELQLVEPSPENCTILTVVQEDGLPLSQARIEIALAGDLPFFRQWPTDLTLDEQGSVSVPGLEPGMVLGLLIRHDSLAHGGYVPRRPTVPLDRRIELRLPSESYLAFQ